MKERIRKAFHAKSFRYGTFSIIITAVVLAVVIAINLLVGQLPTEILNIDISDQKLYSIGDTTKDLVSALSDDVEIYTISVEGKEDETINQMLKRYADLSEHVSVSSVDPDKNPTFLKNHDLTTEDLSGYVDVLVVSSKRQKLVPYTELYQISYGSGYSYEYYYDGEGQVTSAISYVTTDELPKMYILTGHKEAKYADSISSLLSKNNIETESLNLTTNASIPDDCDVIAIHKPQSDFTEEEVEILEDYIAHGGKCIIVNYADMQENMPNYCKFLAYYGVEIPSGGCIFEASGYCDERARWYVYEPLTSNHEITSGFDSSNIFTDYVQPIYQLDNKRNTLKITSFLSTSDGSWFRTDLSSEKYDEKIESDVDGPFDIAVSIKDQSNEGEGQIILYSAYSIIDSQYVDSGYGYSNAELFMKSVSYLCSLDTSISIDKKSTSMSYNTSNAGQIRLSVMLFEVLIPVIILIAGLVVWIRRRRR